ncbi:hypothetical protein ENUP19_0055G0095 [Entamoeba nuttalli]|uniref:Uncharacterized protein n=1 Tax=Entamoeba nuttalli TaxID=412467 RepID=A0ABQ0DCP2_9EUKA
MIEIQNQEYWKKLFEEEIQILTPQEVEEIKNTKIKEYTSSTIWRRWYFLAQEKTKTIIMEEETISMTMEEDNNQYNPIEIKDNRIYNNYTTKKRGKQTDREEEILTLYKCFVLKLFERKLRGQLKGEIIERLIHEFEIKVNDINEYKEIIKNTFKIKNEIKREINRIMDEEIIKH